MDGQNGDYTTTSNAGGGESTGGGWSSSHTQVTKPAVPTPSAEERRQREVYAREKQALLSAFKLPDAGPRVEVDAVVVAAPNALTDPTMSVHLQQASGLSEVEWARARACQAEIDALTRNWPVPERDRARLENLVTERNILWAKATSAPDLTAEERERLRLRLYTVPQFGKAPVASADAGTLNALPTDTPPDDMTFKENPIALALTQQILTDSATSLVESAGEEWAGDLLGEAAGERFGTVLGIAKLAIAAKTDTAEGLSALGDVLVGLIPLPQVGPTMSTGRIYSNLAYQAMNDFMLKSMQAVGGTADTDAFWKELDDDLSVNMRAYRKWIGFGG